MKYLIAIALALSLISCASSNQNQTQLSSMDGMWVSSYSNDMQVVLFVEESSHKINIELLGEEIVPLHYKKKDDQALIKFKNSRGDVYHMLAQINSANQMRMSVTMEHVNDFIPIGQLGEKVYRLQKVEKEPLKIMASTKKN